MPRHLGGIGRGIAKLFRSRKKMGNTGKTSSTKKGGVGRLTRRGLMGKMLGMAARRGKLPKGLKRAAG
jgi:hypothetical protein